jgi:RNA polymerase sigma-70 factor (ECF subfamily)
VAISVREIDSDASLVHAAQAGDSDAFAELFRRHYESVRRACARRLGSIQEGDEVAQAAFVRAWERIDRCQGDRRFGGWVQVIAQRLCFDGMRDRNRTTPTDINDEAPTLAIADVPEDALLRTETSALVQLALADLPPRQRDVVVARDLHDRRAPEIAAALGLSVGAVDSLLLRGRRRLAEAVTRLSGERGLTTTGSASSVVAGAASTSSRFTQLVNSFQAMVDRVSYQVAAALGVVPGAPGPVGRAVGAGLLGGTLALGAGTAALVPQTPLAVPAMAAPSVPKAPTIATPAAPAAPTPSVVAPTVSAPHAPTVVAPAAPSTPATPAAHTLTAAATAAVADALAPVNQLLDQLGVSAAVGNLRR